MSTILHLDSSIFGENGASTRLGREFVDRWLEVQPETRVIRRDLAAEPLPHLDATAVAGFMTEAEARTPAQAEAVARSDAAIDELMAADVLVIGLPLYNLGVPSTFKAWIDHVARAGATFRYTEAGPEGLAGAKKVYVFATRGGVYAGSDVDTQTPYIRHILGLMGITDIEFVHAEGLNMGDAARDAALEAAGRRLGDLAAA
ncbi:MAG: NAD(P)H-dependent oxidoreductase [Alphaproteobacteria bacterium]|jgi:FMN-dependent NADH-azoreductase|nr:NAD(P)H-dependent oxidoreductase [Alphaproteobacteria bacterium]